MTAATAETPGRSPIVLVALAAVVLLVGGLVVLMRSPAPGSPTAARRTPSP